MIHVIATITVKPESRAVFLECFKGNIPAVLAEDGCIEYAPTLDLDANLPPQVLCENTITIIEKWASLDALRAHLVAPHMLAYKDQVAEMVTDVTLKVLQEA